MKAQFLKKIPLFVSFSDQECREIMRIAREKSFLKNKAVFKEGERGDAMFIIVSGEVMIEKQPLLKSTGAISTLHMKAGDFFGELSLFDKGPRTSTARALEKTLALSISREGFMRLLRKKSGIGSKLFENIIQIISTRVRHTNQELMAFYEVGRMLSLPHNTDVLMENVMQILTAALSVRQGLIVLKNKITELFELKACKGCDKQGLDVDVIVNDEFTQKVLSQMKPLLITQKKGKLLVPFGPENNVGVVILSGKAFDQNDLNLVSAVMRQIDTVLQNIEFHEEAEGRQRLARQYFRL